MTTPSTPSLRFPRITIEFCVQCKWNLRAAYFAQELLQTFSTSIGEISLIPVTGGVFTITLYHQDTPASQADPNVNSEDVIPLTEQTTQSFSTSVIWDRKRDGGFPETKELKNRVRNIIEPDKDMGHVDRALRKGKENKSADGKGETAQPSTNNTGNAQEASKSAEGETEITSKSTVHAMHKDDKSPPDDCEECKEASRNEAGS